MRPVLGCPIAFGAFALGYFLCEGPVFGDVTQGGDPATTNVVFWDLVYLPLGVFVASDIGSHLSAKRQQRRGCTLLWQRA